MADFNYELDIDVRFRDIDAMGHVNNAVYSTYLEQARIQYIEDVVGEPLMDTGTVIANLEVDFRHPIDYGDDVTVTVRADGIGNSSIPIVHEIRANGEVAATAETLMVTYDREADESRPLPETWRERIAEFEGLDEA